MTWCPTLGDARDLAVVVLLSVVVQTTTVAAAVARRVEEQLEGHGGGGGLGCGGVGDADYADYYPCLLYTSDAADDC